MKHILLRLMGFLRRISAEPEAVRRRWAKILFVGSLPVVALAWWLSLHYSLVDRTASDAARSAASTASAAATDVMRGIANLKTTISALRAALDQELRRDESAPESSATERFTLPIVD
jgi:hypothetical protein